MANTALFLLGTNCLPLQLHPAFLAGPWKPRPSLRITQKWLLRGALRLWVNVYCVPNSGEVTLSLRLEGAQTRASIKAKTNSTVRPQEGL